MIDNDTNFSSSQFKSFTQRNGKIAKVFSIAIIGTMSIEVSMDPEIADLFGGLFQSTYSFSLV